jgi:hypothetical protein
MQISLHTASSAETYVTNHEWRIAQLPGCPLHPKGGCSFARHGSYPRVTPRGLRIARWYCPEGHRTFSLLPDFLAARLPDLLDSIEESVTVAHSAKSLEAAADLLRGPDVGLPGATRWLRRRVQSVRAALAAVTRLVPMLPAGIDIDERHFLRRLRRSLPTTVLANIPAPLGFEAFRWAGRTRDGVQQDEGPDGGRRHRYGWAFKLAVPHATPTATTDVRNSNPHRGRHVPCVEGGSLRARRQCSQLHSMDQVVSLLCVPAWTR